MTLYTSMEFDGVITRLTDGGRVVVPAEYRRALQIEVGDEVVLYLEDHEIRILPRREALRRAKEIFGRYVKRPIVDEFIAERQKEAERE